MPLPFQIKKNKKHHSLSGILLFYFLSFFMTIFFIMGVVVVLISFRNQQRIVFSQQQLVAHDAGDTVRDFINEKIIAMETTARLVNPATTSPKEQKRALNYLFGPHVTFRQLVLINSKKQRVEEISRLSQAGSPQILNEEIWNELFARAEQGKRYISEVCVDRRTREPMVVIGVPVNDVFGDFQGVLAADVNLKFMWDLVENIAIGKTGVAYVVDRKGKLIAYGDISRVLQGENISNINIVNEFINNPVSVDKAQVDIFNGIQGTMVIGSYVSLMEPDFAVVTEQSIMEAYQTVIRFWVLFLVFAIIMWGMIVWISIRLARRLSVPLVSLMNIAVRIAGGERGLHAEVSGPVEIAAMANAFNSMTAQLNEVIESLERRSEYLQATVQKYVAYMERVGSGKLDTFLTIEEKEGETDDPLIILGQQLNDTTLNLNRKIRQIEETTEKLKMKEEILLVYSNQLEKSNRELEQFAYIASHDLQEPLRKLKFFSEKLKKDYGTFVDEKGMEYLERMMNAASRMENLIKGLLQYSRVTTKAQPFEKVDLNEIMKGVMEDLEIRIHETGAEIKTEHLPVIEADPLQMRQLFQNLLGNAIKYKRENVQPVVTIHAKVKSNNDNNICEINIIDNGMGFDNKYKEQIFGLFKRLYGRDEYEGTGIGLAICKKIVEQHRGVISASGKAGEGATFCIVLPLEQKT
jgi:signal transduction histidine kinase